MGDWKRDNFLQLTFLELLSISPVLIILGNVVPPFPIKIHHIGLGLVIVLALILLLKDVYKKWIIYFALFFVIFQFFLDAVHVKGILDFFFGPFVLVVMLDILVNKRIEEQIMKKYLKRFFVLLWIPPLIAVLQFFHVLPITFWNAAYINYAYFGELAIPRPNGYLYHGSELSIIVTFLGLHQYFKKEKQAIGMLLLVIGLAYMTYFKALLACVTLLFVFYLFFVNRGKLSKIQLIPKKWMAIGFCLVLVTGISYGTWYFTSYYSATGEIFPRDMLTGRGAIWNIYLEGVASFSWYQYLIGNGLGSSFSLFAEFATAQNWWRLAVDPNADVDYDSHNALLSIFVHAGIIGLTFIFFLFKILYSASKKWTKSVLERREMFFGIFILPLLTIGVTITIFENAIYWICLSFLIWAWYFESMKKAQISE